MIGCESSPAGCSARAMFTERTTWGRPHNLAPDALTWHMLLFITACMQQGGWGVSCASCGKLLPPAVLNHRHV